MSAEIKKEIQLEIAHVLFIDIVGYSKVSINDQHAAIDSSAREIGPFGYIDHAANWPAVDSHPKVQARMFLERAADLHRALRGCFRIGVKDQRHPVAGRDFKQTACGFGSLKLLGRANNLLPNG